MEKWDQWKQDARQAGVPEDLAELGCAFVRQNYQQGWNFEADEDFEEKLIELALTQPEAARSIWDSLGKGDTGLPMQ